MSRRKWSSWPSRFAREIESTSGAVGLLSGLATMTGLVVAAPMATAIGGVGLLGAIIFAGRQSIPPKMRLAAHSLGEQISLLQLAEIDPPPFKLAVVGASQSGKSTFLSAAQHSPSPNRTNRIYAEILMLPGNPATYVALLDADGAEFIQQFEILKEADLIFIFVDHNATPNFSGKSDERLKEHDVFIRQVKSAIKRRKILPDVHFLINKRDLWQSGSDAPELTSWYERHVEGLGDGNYALNFSCSMHSNWQTNDLTALMALIKKLISQRISS